MPSDAEPQDRSWVSGDGRAQAFRRPDDRWQLSLPATAPDAWPGLVAELRRDASGTVITAAPSDDDLEPLLRGAGLLPARRIQHWTVPIDAERLARIGLVPGAGPAHTWHPSTHRLLRVTDAELTAVVGLDNVLRHEIPGTAGWHGTVADLRDELDSAAFDPQLYLIAQDERTGRLDGLIRVWLNDAGPRLGCIAVRASARGTRVTGALISAVAAVLTQRGYAEITAETDADNRAAVRLARRLGAAAGRIEVEWEVPTG
jgi:GNAT superfamily N-acetyltransferase